jgi:tetratricopeptide (TPR) repeat protein/TolB-like protein/tRNA A-37 threonylcarbamoyl transferase component Bud32
LQGSKVGDPANNESSGKGTSADQKSKPRPNSPSSARWERAGDHTIDSHGPSAGAQGHEEPNVSILSKTPSGANLPDDNLMENASPDTLLPESDAPVARAGKTPSGRRSGGSRADLSGVLEPGMDFGPRFRIEKLLGAGGMGKVYKAFDKELSRMVALKTLQPELISDPLITERFKQELLLSSKISHRHILRIHDLSDIEGVKYISMAFIEGKDLHQLMKSEGPFPLERSLNIAKQLCEALDAAHSEGVVHRDFKPQNVLVGKDDHAYISDFGLATSFETAKMGMTRTGALVGTPRYMSPEQVEGKPVDSRADIYAFGLVFYEMTAGEVPFSSGSTWQSMYKRVQEAPKEVRQVNPAVPESIARVIMHCLEKDPANRYQTAKEILADLDAGRVPALSTTLRVQKNLARVDQSWWYAVGGLALLIGLFFAIPKTRHWIFPAPPAAVETPTAGPSGLPSLSQGKFVAVLPFRVLGDQASLGYVADGLVEAISAKLFQLKEVRLASSAAAAKIDPKTPFPQVAKELGVNLIVHGTVQGSGDNLRVTVNLEDVADNRVVWSQDFAGVTGDLLTIEDHIYTRLIDALESKPSDAEMAATTAHPTENVEAYNQYLKGRNALGGTPDEKNIQSAMNYFNVALQKDPGFALAYAGLADADLMMYGEKKDKYWSEKAVDAAKQAARFNDKLPEVHFALGSAYAATGQTVQAIAEQKRALELAPNSDGAYRRLGNAYKANGQKQESLNALEKAVEINPYYWNNLAALGKAYFAFGESDKAVKVFKQIIQLEPDNPAGYNNLGGIYLNLGNFEESIPVFQKSLQIQPSGDTYSNLGTAFFYLKRYPEAVPMFEKAVELSPDDETNMGNLADGYRMAGDKTKAQATYEKAIGLAYKQLRVNPRDASVVGNLALYYAKKGDPQQAKDFVAKARAIAPSDVYLMYTAAVVDTINNQPADAVKELQGAIEKGYSFVNVAADPEFRPLESRTDFQAMMKRFSAKKR